MPGITTKNPKPTQYWVSRGLLVRMFLWGVALTGVLKRYGRVKKMGLPERYRLFFRAFDTPLKVIVILWLGFPRKEGAKNDCYEVFTKMVIRGTFPDSLDRLLADCEIEDELE